MIKKKKFIFLITFILIIFFCFIFNNQILKFCIEKTFSKWLQREVIVSELVISLKKKKIILKNVAVKNNNNKSKYLLKTKQIIIEYELKDLFKGVLIVKNFNMENSSLNIEIFKINEKVFKDNIDIAEKITSNKPDKIWPKKIFDFNFIIQNTQFTDLKIKIKSEFFQKENQISLGKMQYSNIGNHKSSKHYKDILKNIMIFAVLNLEDGEFKKQIQKIYKLN